MADRHKEPEKVRRMIAPEDGENEREPHKKKKKPASMSRHTCDSGRLADREGIAVEGYCPQVVRELGRNSCGMGEFRRALKKMSVREHFARSRLRVGMVENTKVTSSQGRALTL